MIQKREIADRNVLGGELGHCCSDPLTGFYRDGCCRTGEDDLGVHSVCCQVTAEFLEFSRRAGNDLSTPMPEFGFPGLKPGDRWCVCAARWREAFDAGFAPPVVLESTHEATLRFVIVVVSRIPNRTWRERSQFAPASHAGYQLYAAQPPAPRRDNATHDLSRVALKKIARRRNLVYKAAVGLISPDSKVGVCVCSSDVYQVVKYFYL